MTWRRQRGACVCGGGGAGQGSARAREARAALNAPGVPPAPPPPPSVPHLAPLPADLVLVLLHSHVRVHRLAQHQLQVGNPPIRLHLLHLVKDGKVLARVAASVGWLGVVGELGGVRWVDRPVFRGWAARFGQRGPLTPTHDARPAAQRRTGSGWGCSCAPCRPTGGSSSRGRRRAPPRPASPACWRPGASPPRQTGT